MNGILDIYSLWHILGGLFLGLFLFFLMGDNPNKRIIALFVALPIGWEIFEQNVLVSWLKLLQPEIFLNSIADIFLVLIPMFLTYIIIRKINMSLFSHKGFGFFERHYWIFYLFWSFSAINFALNANMFLGNYFNVPDKIMITSLSTTGQAYTSLAFYWLPVSIITMVALFSIGTFLYIRHGR